ncbi:hypothetical protein B0H13DRAFT_651371 [Mycena leptocephala]|nr:hypothetical protein B0H13DRAFT_651371 [Mycena leptocephala]
MALRSGDFAGRFNEDPADDVPEGASISGPENVGGTAGVEYNEPEVKNTDPGARGRPSRVAPTLIVRPRRVDPSGRGAFTSTSPPLPLALPPAATLPPFPLLLCPAHPSRFARATSSTMLIRLTVCVGSRGAGCTGILARRSVRAVVFPPGTDGTSASAEALSPVMPSDARRLWRGDSTRTSAVESDAALLATLRIVLSPLRTVPLLLLFFRFTRVDVGVVPPSLAHPFSSTSVGERSRPCPPIHSSAFRALSSVIPLRRREPTSLTTRARARGIGIGGSLRTSGSSLSASSSFPFPHRRRPPAPISLPPRRPNSPRMLPKNPELLFTGTLNVLPPYVDSCRSVAVGWRRVRRGLALERPLPLQEPALRAGRGRREPRILHDLERPRGLLFARAAPLVVVPVRRAHQVLLRDAAGERAPRERE